MVLAHDSWTATFFPAGITYFTIRAIIIFFHAAKLIIIYFPCKVFLNFLSLLGKIKYMKNLLELFAGSRCVGTAGEELGFNVFSVDWEPYDNIDLVMDIGEMQIEDVPFVPDVVWPRQIAPATQSRPVVHTGLNRFIQNQSMQRSATKLMFTYWY